MKATRPCVASGDNYSLDKNEQFPESSMVGEAEIDGICFSLDAEPDIIGERRSLVEEGFGVREKPAGYPIGDTPMRSLWQQKTHNLSQQVRPVR